MAGALIKFVQGVLTPPAGQALIGVAGTLLVCTNNDNTNIVAWKWELIDVPPGSALLDGVFSTLASGSCTPDVPGGYLVKLTTTDNLTNVYTDTRAFLVPEDTSYNRIIAPFSAVADALNVAGSTRGWAPFMESYLHVLDRIGDWGGTPGNTDIANWNSTNKRWQPITVAALAAALAAALTGIVLTGDVNGTNNANHVDKLTPASSSLNLIGPGPITRGTWETTHGRLTAGGGGTDSKAILGPRIGAETTDAALWLLNNATAPTGTNYTLDTDGTDLTINVVGAGGIYMFSTGSVQLAGVTTAAFRLNIQALAWEPSIGSPDILMSAKTSDVATTRLRVKGQDAWNNVAATQTTGGDVLIEAGASATASGYPGNVHVYLPVNGSILRGKFWVEDAGNGTIFGVGVDPIYGQHNLWLADAATPANSSNANAALIGVGTTTTYLNASTSVGFNIGGGGGAHTVGYYTATTWTIGNSSTISTIVLSTIPSPGEYIALETNRLYLDAATWHIRDANHTAVLDANIQQGGGATTFAATGAVTALSWGISQSTLGAGANFTLYAGSSLAASATAGGNLIAMYGAGDGVADTNTPGAFIINNTSNAHMDVRIGGYPTTPETYGTIYFLPHATASTTSNFALLGNQLVTYLNAPSGGNVILSIGGSSLRGKSHSYTGGTTWTETVGSAVSLWTMSMTTAAAAGGAILIQAGDAGGTSDGGNLSLIAGAGAGGGVYGQVILGASGTTSSLVFNGSAQWTYRTSAANFTIDTTTTDNVVRLSATQTVTMPTPTTGRRIEFIIDSATGAAAVTVTWARHGTEKINTIAASYVVTFQAGGVFRVVFLSDGTDWYAA